MRSRCELALIAALLLSACGDDDATPMPGDDAGPAVDSGGIDSGSPPDAGPEPVAWERCSLFSGLPGEGAECATIDVPLRYDDPEGEQVGIFVKRVLGRGGLGQLWALMGGPGGAGASFEGTATELVARSGGLDVYLIDHRGVGDSARLGCPQEDPGSEEGIRISDAELAPCLAALTADRGDELDAFTTTNAARDLGTLIDRLRQPGERIMVYGVSYGTHWAHRYLQIFPDQADGVVLDSICSPRQCTFPTGFARNHDAIGRDLLALCAADTDCAARVGPDPAATLRDVLTRLDTGHCSAAVTDPVAIRFALGVLVQVLGLRDAIPAVIHRLDRCDADDVVALQVFDDFLQEPPDFFADERFSPLLQLNIVRAELWEDSTPTEAEYATFIDGQLFASGVPPSAYATFAGVTPSYAPDEFHETLATTSVPLLMMNGTLDPQTPESAADPIGMHFTGPNQTYVRFEKAPHWVIYSTRRTPDNFFDSCGLDITEQFLQDPTAALDTTCASDDALLDFDGDVMLARMLFNSDDLYFGSTANGPLVMDARLRHLREQARRAFQRARSPGAPTLPTF